MLNCCVNNYLIFLTIILYTGLLYHCHSCHCCF